MKKISLREKICYAVGTVGYNPGDTIVLAYLVLYGTDVLGLSAGILGILILIPKFMDIISDFLVMDFVDRTKTRFGTYRPWLLSAIPLAICFFLLFSYPAFLKTSAVKLLWLAVIYFIMVGIFETSYWCPYSTLSGIITDDEEDRTSLVSSRSIAENISGFAVGVFIFPMLNFFGDGYRDPAGWRRSVAIFGILMIVSALICFLGIKERIHVQSTVKDNISIAEKFKLVLGNSDMRKNIIILSLVLIMSYAYYTIASYFYIYVLGHEEWITLLGGFNILFSVVGSATANTVINKIGKDRTVCLGALLCMLSGMEVIFANSFVSMIVFSIIKDFGIMYISIAILADLPAIVDRITEMNQSVKQGVVFGIYSSFQKLFIALGGFLGTMSVYFSKYDETIQVQETFTLNFIRYSITVSMIVCAAAIMAVKAKDLKAYNIHGKA